MEESSVRKHKCTYCLAVHEENAELHRQIVAKDTELTMQDRRIAALAAERHGACDCLACSP